MKKLVILLLSCLAPSLLFAYNGNGVWRHVTGSIPTTGLQALIPTVYTTYSLNTAYLKTSLSSASQDPESASVIDIPTPDGNFRSYKIWQTPIVEPGLAAKYPDFKTFSGYAVGNQLVTIKLDYTRYGVHAMIFDGRSTYFIDPYSNVEDGFYICYYKRDYVRPVNTAMACETGTENKELKEGATYLTETGLPDIKFKVNGTFRRTYRLALACTGEYAAAVDGPTPTKAGVLSKMVTSLNRVNGVFERELAISLTLIANNDTLIFLNPVGDPYSNSSSDMGTNKSAINTRIGSANYDIGHLFGTGIGGVAIPACVCTPDKAMGITGQPNPTGDAFDIDYVVHEMGHQFGADHSFNAGSGSCAGNGEQSQAYEPGSGSSIMGYAGICGAGDNLQAHSDDYFHAISLDIISTFISTGPGATCAISTPILNVPPVIPPFTQTFNVPYLTPFELVAPTAVDVDHDIISYCWEQWNLGDYQSSWANTQQLGPIFRSLPPSASQTRVFPRIDSLVKNVKSYIGEKLPASARSLKFKLTVRDMLNGIGSFNFANDSITLSVINTGSPFEVTHPNTSINWKSGDNETITWDVAKTDISPINCSTVDIYLSIDGGFTYPIQLAANTPNDGSEAITVPTVAMTATARVKIKGHGNVFFDISNTDFAVNDPSSVKEISWQNAIKIYPIPSDEVLHVSNDYKRKLGLTVVNALGQRVYEGEVVKRASIQVSSWVRGIYYVSFNEMESGERIVRTIVVQ